MFKKNASGFELGYSGFPWAFVEHCSICAKLWSGIPPKTLTEWKQEKNTHTQQRHNRHNHDNDATSSGGDNEKDTTKHQGSTQEQERNKNHSNKKT